MASVWDQTEGCRELERNRGSGRHTPHKLAEHCTVTSDGTLEHFCLLCLQVISSVICETRTHIRQSFIENKIAWYPQSIKT